MLISHQYKSIFIAIPHTGSTIIEEVLVNNYGFKSIRNKHSLPVYLPKETKGYKIIGGVCDPSSDMSTMYWKFKNDHLGLYSEALKNKKKMIRHKSIGKRGLYFFKKVNSGSWDFNQFIKKSTSPFFVSKINVNKSMYHYIYNKDSLEKDWREIKFILGIYDSFELPRKNITQKKQKLTLNKKSKEILEPQELLFNKEEINPTSKKLIFFMFMSIKVFIWKLIEYKKILLDKNYRELR